MPRFDRPNHVSDRPISERFVEGERHRQHDEHRGVRPRPLRRRFKPASERLRDLPRPRRLAWDPARAVYPWMTPALDRLRRPFDHADVVAEQAEVGVGATVLVQAADNLEDTANMLRVARAHPQVAGVVAWVPLDDPAAAARLLDGWHQTGEPVVGVRHLVHREADPDWLLRPQVQDGLAVLAERGLTFDVCAETAPLLRHVPTLAARHPALSLVVNHLGKPPIRERGWQPWADLLAAAAEAPNLTAKVSGLNTAADPEQWSLVPGHWLFTICRCFDPA